MVDGNRGIHVVANREGDIERLVRKARPRGLIRRVPVWSSATPAALLMFGGCVLVVLTGRDEVGWAVASLGAVLLCTPRGRGEVR